MAPAVTAAGRTGTVRLTGSENGEDLQKLPQLHQPAAAAAVTAVAVSKVHTGQAEVITVGEMNLIHLAAAAAAAEQPTDGDSHLKNSGSGGRKKQRNGNGCWKTRNGGA